MIKKYSLVFIAFLCFVLSGFGQAIFTNPITGTNPNTANPYTTGQTFDANIIVSGIGRGSGIVGTNANDRYTANSWNTLSIDLTAYFEFTLTPESGYEIDFVSFVYTGQASGTGATTFAFRSSLDAFSTNLGTPIAAGATISLAAAAFQNIAGPITFRLYGWGASAATGTFSVNDFTFNGTVTSTSTATVDWCNLQSPATGNTTVGTVYDVYARVYEDGVTNLAGSDPSILGWIGYNTVNNDPSSAGWTWKAATFNTQYGNNDEYVANIGTLPTLASGTYYYASRFQISGGPYRYGGYNAGGGDFWNGTSNVSGVLSVDTPDFVNLQFPRSGTAELGEAFPVYGQVYEQNLTPGAGQGTGIQAEIGYSTLNTNPNSWTNWVSATYNSACTDTCNGLQNDEYSANLGGAITVPGTYYYATRFRLNGGAWFYGGILDNGTSGNFWDGTTYLSGVLTVNSPPPPSNDLCANAISLTVGAATTNGTLAWATPTSGLGQQPTKNDVWYQFTPTCSGNYNITTLFSSGPDIDLYIYASSCPITGNAAASSTTTNTINEIYTGTYNFIAGTTYYIRVLDFNNNATNFNIRVTARTPVITTQPANQTRTIPANGIFTVASSSTPGATYQWQLSTDNGTTWNNVTNGTGGTTTSYTTVATTEAMNGYRYRCVVTNACIFVNSNAAVLTLNNPNAVNASAFSGCFLDDSVNLSWTPPGTTPEGYVIFAIEGSTAPNAPPANTASAYSANSNFNVAPFETPVTQGKVVYKGSGTSATVTGLNEDTIYSFRIFSYNGQTLTRWSSGTTAGTNTTDIAQDDVRNLVATPNTNQVNLTWNNPLPTSCFDELIIVANQGPVVFTPTGSYGSINVDYSTPNSVVYSVASGSSKGIGGLTNDLNYCFKIFIRRGGVWSDGVEICATPTLTHCASSGNTSFATGIDGVILNTINNTGTSTTNAYTDYTAISTNLTLGELYDLSVIVNVDGNNTVYTKVWIDWNQNGSFNDSGEEYDLGTIFNASSTVDLLGATSASPLSIVVPSGATIGATRMRVSSKWAAYSTSCETGFSGEVEDYTINVQRPTDAEINVKGLAIPIPNGFNSPYGLNNTLFASTNIGASAGAKTYTIENLGLATLNLTGSPRVILTGDHPGDFSVTQQPAAATIASAGTLTFQINFTPTADGERTAIVSITNNDVTGGENPYTFKIKGTGNCTSTITSTILPNSGPVGTEVTITSPSALTGASATLNGMSMPIVSSSETQLVVKVPNGAISGVLQVILSNGCSSSNTFTLINTAINGCEASSSSAIPSDLFITEVTDATSGSSSYVEIFNGTGSPINLNDYSIRIFNNGNSFSSSTNVLSGTIIVGGTHVITIGTTDCTPNNLPPGSVDQTFNSAGGINFDNNSSDLVALYKISTASIIDACGVYGSNSWANGLGVDNNGVNFRRKNTASPLPSALFNPSDWDVIDWTSCGDSDYANIGVYDFSVGVPPNVTLQPIAPLSSCDLTATLTVAATEGYNGVDDTQELAYQWFYNAPGTNTWTEILSTNTAYSGQQSAVLSIPNTLNLDNYQYYSQIRENGITCFKASHAIKINAEKSTWNGSAWAPAPPDINTIAVIDGNYSTSVGGEQISFSACQLLVNSSYTLDISDNTYVEVENNVTVDGSIIIAPRGAFVQINDLGDVNGEILTDKTKITINKRTAPMDNWYEYTYWSSPVVGDTIGSALTDAPANRRFKFSAPDFRDSFTETSNNNSFDPGHDDIDDDPNSIFDGTGSDWQLVPESQVMLPGVGYASTHRASLFATNPCLNNDNGTGSGCQFIYSFRGPFNNGIIRVPVYRNDEELDDNNWNLIGNPYASAISADAFLNLNADIPAAGNRVIDGAIYLWSQHTDANANANGNQNQNFSNDDYAIINGAGETTTSTSNPNSTGSDPSNRMIPSGQGFFVAMSDATDIGTTLHSDPSGDPGDIQTKDVEFNNSMRVKGATDNSQFYRNAMTSSPFNKIKINLTSDNGIFSQIFVGYMDGATDAYDGMYYDAPRNQSNSTFSSLYTLIPDSDRKFAIQAKSPNSLTLDEVIPLGFYTSINQATIYKLSIARLEGEFFSIQTVYLKDNFLNVIHDLSASDYHFTSETGEYKERFEIVFRNTTLSVIDNEIPTSGLSIIELPNGQVKFSVGNSLDIKAVEIIDMLGRTLYQLQGNAPTEIYDLSNLSQAAYIAKVTLSNGQVITKRAVKRL